MSKSNISYRTVKESDREFLFRLFESTRDDIRKHATKLSYVEQTELIRMQFQAQDKHYKKFYPDAEFLIIKSRNKDIGRLYIEEWPSQIRIIDITIDPKFRGKGLGGQIMADIIRKSESKGKATSIHVAKDNRALNLYNRLGFEIDGGTEVYHLMVRPANSQMEVS